MTRRTLPTPVVSTVTSWHSPGSEPRHSVHSGVDPREPASPTWIKDVVQPPARLLACTLTMTVGGGVGRRTPSRSAGRGGLAMEGGTCAWLGTNRS